MIEFNLLPWRENLRARTRRNFLRALCCVVLGIVVLSGGAGYGLRQSLSEQQSLNLVLRQKLAALEPPLTELRALRERGAALAQRTAVLQMLDEQRAQDALLLDALARVVPEGAYYTALTREGGSLQLSGMASGVELTKLIRALATFPQFAVPELRDIAAPRADARGAFTLIVPLRIVQEITP